MRKVAIFTEGQGEQIFVRQLLYQVIGYESLSFECIELRAKNSYNVLYPYSAPNPIVHYLIVNVGNDEGVLKAMLDRQENLFSKGYDVIIGLRDMYSEAYKRRSPSRIDNTVTELFINSLNEIIRSRSDPTRVHIFFAIMEFESWLLSMHRLLEKFNPILNREYIESELGFNLSKINPETEFFRPSSVFKQVLSLVGENYKKSQGQMESILINMVEEDIENALEETRCSQSFGLFLSKIKTSGQSNEGQQTG